MESGDSSRIGAAIRFQPAVSESFLRAEGVAPETVSVRGVEPGMRSQKPLAKSRVAVSSASGSPTKESQGDPPVEPEDDEEAGMTGLETWS